MTLRSTPQQIVDSLIAEGRAGALAGTPGWPRVRLGDVARVTNGAPYRSSLFNTDGEGMPLIRIRDVGAGQPSTWYSGDWEKTHLVQHGDLLVGMDGDFRAAHWRSEDALLNQRVCRLDLTGTTMDARFFFHALQPYLDAIWAATSSTTVKHLSSRSIADIPLPHPPLGEQRRIVAVLEDHLSRLDAADAYLAASSQRLVALSRSTLRAVIDSPERLRRTLSSSVLRLEAGKSLGGSAPPAQSGEWGIVKVSAMTWGTFRAEENKAIASSAAVPRYEIKAGDLLVSRANTTAYVGAAVLVPEDVRPRLLLSDKSLRVVPQQDTSAPWLRLALSTPRVRAQISAQASGTKDSMRNISQSALLGVSIPDVDRATQAEDVRRIAEADEAVARLGSAARLSSQRHASLRRALLTAAFTGRLTGRSSDMDIAEELAEATT